MHDDYINSFTGVNRREKLLEAFKDLAILLNCDSDQFNAISDYEITFDIT